MSRIAPAWLNAQPAVSSVIIGARTSGQLADNLGSVDVALSIEDIATLDTASDPEPSAWPYGAAGREQRFRVLDWVQKRAILQFVESSGHCARRNRSSGTLAVRRRLARNPRAWGVFINFMTFVDDETSY